MSAASASFAAVGGPARVQVVMSVTLSFPVPFACWSYAGSVMCENTLVELSLPSDDGGRPIHAGKAKDEGDEEGVEQRGGVDLAFADHIEGGCGVEIICRRRWHPFGSSSGVISM